MAFSAVRSHVLRSILTLLGVWVGVFSIILTMTAIRILQTSLETQLSQLGAHTFQIQKWPAIRVDGDAANRKRYANRKELYLADARKLRDRAKLPRAIGVMASVSFGEVRSDYAKTNPNTRALGVAPDTFYTQNWTIAEGRPIAAPDEEGARLVCVLGAELAKRLFPLDTAVGQTVRFHGVPYQVIGVLEAKGAIFGQSQDDFFILPITTALDRFGRRLTVQVQVQAFDEARYESTLEETRGILRTLRKVPPGEDDDFEIVSNDSLVSQFRSLTLGLRIGSAVIASIALVAAGIGIMNIMLVSVTERTREIGIRRAIGARRSSILSQFLSEAIVLSELGGVLGIATGLLAGNLVAVFTKSPPTVPWDWVAIGFLICTLVGVIFGTYPAWKAAQLDPIESLRHE
jgi:putative ABC transport system permease protein